MYLRLIWEAVTNLPWSPIKLLRWFLPYFYSWTFLDIFYLVFNQYFTLKIELDYVLRKKYLDSTWKELAGMKPMRKSLEFSPKHERGPSLAHVARRHVQTSLACGPVHGCGPVYTLNARGLGALGRVAQPVARGQCTVYVHGCCMACRGWPVHTREAV